jgi:hypothetical protein
MSALGQKRAFAPHKRMSALGQKQTLAPQKAMSALPPNVLQNYFEGVARAILIQDQTKMSNVDSPHRSIGFDYCAIAMRQRVLQHIPPNSGPSVRLGACPLYANSGLMHRN